MTESEMFKRIEYLKGEFIHSIEVEAGKAIVAALQHHREAIYEDHSEVYRKIFIDACNIIGGYVRAMGEVRSE